MRDKMQIQSCRCELLREKYLCSPAIYLFIINDSYLEIVVYSNYVDPGGDGSIRTPHKEESQGGDPWVFMPNFSLPLKVRFYTLRSRQSSRIYRKL